MWFSIIPLLLNTKNQRKMADQQFVDTFFDNSGLNNKVSENILDNWIMWQPTGRVTRVFGKRNAGFELFRE